MSDRHNIFGEPERPHPSTEQRTRIPLVQMKDDDGGRGQRPPSQPPAGGKKPRRSRLILAIVADVLVAALILLVFYISNYEMPTDQEGFELPGASMAGTATPGPTQSDPAVPGPSGSIQPSASTTPVIADPTSWRAKFADKFTTGDVVKTANSYQSANVNIKVDKISKDGVVYYVVDIYLADLKHLKTAFAKTPDKMGATEHATKIGQENNAIVAINGDYCSANRGVVVRNGKWFNNGAKESDQLVLYNDGTMKTFTSNELDAEKIKTQGGVWQVWTFGPMLLKDGKPMSEFNSTLMRANARSAIGYYEPGHYCFVMVDVGNPSKSAGMTLTQLSQLFAELKCKAAFNLDGGHSAEMAFDGKVYSMPQDGGRPVSDIVYIAE